MPESRTNHLIAGLPDDVRERWRPRLERVKLPQGLALHEPSCEMRYVYFPTTAVVSLVYETTNGASLEFAAVGNEGVVGVELLLGGGSTPSRAVVRADGQALRLPARTVQDEIDRGGAAAHLLLRYTMALLTQVAQAAACNRHHSVQQRVCRWLLMNLDRVPGDKIAATHEDIAYLLGMRREGVTEAALHLHRQGLIRYTRGHIIVANRKGLEKLSCECYAAVKREYDRLLAETLARPGLGTAEALRCSRSVDLAESQGARWSVALQNEPHAARQILNRARPGSTPSRARSVGKASQERGARSAPHQRSSRRST